MSRLTVAFVLGLCVAAGAMADEPGGDPAERLARPTPGQVAYHNLEVQAMLHWSPATWQGREYDNRSTPLEAINPDALDTDQWCEAARSFGAKQIVFVAKHTSGFCWWQTETSDYGVRQLPWRDGKADVLAELADSCRRSGLKLGIYVYPGDDRFGAGIGSGGRTKDPARQEEYNRVFRQQLTEVLTRYGEIGEVWFDGSCRIEVGDILAKHAPEAMVFQGPQATLRWVGNEEGIAPYPAWQTVRRADGARGLATAAHGDPDGEVWMPLECDTTLIDHKWFWAPDTDSRLKSLDRLMEVYEGSVGRGCVLLLNATPDTSGRIPESHMARYRELGEEIKRRYGSPLAETSGEGATLELPLKEPAAINQVVLMEDITGGHRVRGFRLEGLAPPAGEATAEPVWTPLVADGSAIGHKLIARFPEATVSRVRLVVTQAVGSPRIRQLAVFHVEGPEPQRSIAGDALWPLDEGSGEVTRGIAGSQGKAIGATIDGAGWAAGRRGQAVDLTSAADRVDLGPVDLADGDFTLAAWVWPRDRPGKEDRVISQETVGDRRNQLRLFRAEEDRLGFMITGYAGGLRQPLLSEPDTLPAERWTHVAITRRGPQLTLFIDGREAAATSTGRTVIHAGRVPLRLGGAAIRKGGFGHGFSGLVDEVRLFRRALDPAELADPAALPEPGWREAATIAADAFGDQPTIWEIDISAGVPRPGDFAVVLQPADGLEVEKMSLVIGGELIPDRIERLPDGGYGLYRMAQTSSESPTVIRMTARRTGSPTAVRVLVRDR